MNSKDWRDFEVKLYKELISIGIHNNIAKDIVFSNGKLESDVISDFIRKNKKYIKKS